MNKKLVFILITLFLFSGTFHSISQGAAMEPYGMWAVTKSDSSKVTLDVFWVDGVAPWDLGSLKVSGPNGYQRDEYGLRWNNSYNYKDNMFYEVGWGWEWEWDEGSLADGDYIFKLYDTNGTELDTKTVTGFVYNELDIVNISSATPATGSYVYTTTPVFSWIAISDETAAPYYRIFIREYNTDGYKPIYISDRNTSTTHTVDALYPLDNDTSYQWRVETYDNDNIAANNVSMSDWASFSTGSDNPAVIPLDITSAYIRSRVRSNGSTGTQMIISITGPSPEDVTIEATGPIEGSENTYTLSEYYQTYFYYGTNEELAEGTYTFTVTDNRPEATGGKAEVDRVFDPNWNLKAPENDSYNIEHEAYLDTDRPTFIWEELTGSLFYQLQIFSWDWKSTFYQTERITTTKATIPGGILKTNIAYHYRVRTFDHSEMELGNRADGPSRDFFIANDNDPANISGSVNADASGAGGPIYVLVTDSPVFPGGKEFGFVELAGPGAYKIYTVPRGVDLYIHALYDNDNNGAYSVDDWKGTYTSAPVNLLVSSDTLENPGHNITLTTQVTGASVSGTVSCTNHTSGSIYVAAFDRDSDNAQPIAELTLTAPGSFEFPSLPVDGQFWLKAYWDADGSGSGGPTDLDHEGVHPANPVTVSASGNIDKDIDIQTSGFIRGHIYRHGTTTPIPNIHVYITDSDTNDWLAGTNTDNDGYYIIPLDTGTYNVNACPNCSDEPYAPKQENSVSVTDPNATTVDFYLYDGGTISGFVLESDYATEIANLAVDIQQWDSGDYITRIHTDSNGYFTVRVEPGSYKVSVCPSCDNRPYVGEYYNDTNFDDATEVTVSDGYDTLLNDIILEDAYAISGTINSTNPSGPIANACVSVQTTKCEGGWVNGNKTQTDGTYEIYVPAGTYYVSTQPSCDGDPANSYFIGAIYDGEDGSTNCNSGTPVVIGPDEPDATGKDFSLARGGIISGTVFETNGTTAITGYGWEQGYNISIELFRGDCWNRDWAGGTEIKSDGTFITRGLPEGNYYLQARMPDTDYLDEYWALSASQPTCDDDQFVQVTIGNDESGTNFQLDEAMIISGKVSHSGDPNNTIEDLWVNARIAINDYSFGDSTDVDGEYRIKVPPGQYKVEACASCGTNTGSFPYINEFWNDKPYWDNANLVDVRSTDKAAIDFDLAIGGFISGTIFDSSSVAITGVADIWIEAFSVISAGDPCGERIINRWENIDSTTGEYKITGLPVGDYYLRTSTGCNFYIDQYYDTDPATDGTSCSHADPINLTPGQQITDKYFYLDKGGKITGTITKSDNSTPISNFHIMAFNSSTTHYAASINTDEYGNYCLNLPALTAPTGTDYKIETCAQCSGPAPYIDEFYQNKYSFNIANDVKAILNGETSGIDFSLNAIVAGDIDGDEDIDLADVILGLQIMSGTTPADHIFTTCDIDNDGRISLVEILYIMGEL